jgi:type IV pilus assembly protein PilM
MWVSRLKVNRSAVVGIDFDINTVRLIELSKTRTGICVESYAICETNTISQALNEAIKQSGVKTKLAVIGLPYSAVISKNIQLDARLEEHEIESYLLMNMKKFTGFSVQDICMDFEILGPVKNSPDKVNIEMIAARREQVAAKTELIRTTNMIIKSVDVELFALQRAVLQQSTKYEGAVAVINLKMKSILLSVFELGKILYAKEENRADNDIAQQINSELQLFFATNPCKVNQVIIAGENADSSDLLEDIFTQIGISACTANPFVGMKISEQVDALALRRVAHSMMISCGLALWQFSK